MPGSYIYLVAAIIRSGLKHEGPEYLLTAGGLYWCSMGNLDPEAVLKLALQSYLPDEHSLVTGEEQVPADALQPL